MKMLWEWVPIIARCKFILYGIYGLCRNEMFECLKMTRVNLMGMMVVPYSVCPFGGIEILHGKSSLQALYREFKWRSCK